jgi:MarR-like DNA-binding transcriptional regulator SgrR of sgrS sRNA
MKKLASFFTLSVLVALLTLTNLIFPRRIAMAQESRTIKTYLSFGLPVDPSNVKTLVDLDLSYALASTLVDWSDTRNLNEGLATPVEASTDREFAFKLRPQAKWSDGSAVTASQVVKSFERAKKLHPEDLKSLFEIIDRIEAQGESTVVFRLNRAMGTSQLIHKLTEPMYGVVFVNEDGSVDLKKSSGAFALKKETAQELVLAANPFWYGRDTNMADNIVVRHPPKALEKSDEDAFSADPWPNLIASSSLIPQKIASLYEQKKFSVWNRSLDRVFFLSPAPRLANAEGRTLFQALNQKLDRKTLLDGLSGYHLSQQFFPPGYVIFDREFQAANAVVDIPAPFKGRPLVVLFAEGRMGGALKYNLSETLKKATGIAPTFRSVALADFDKERAAGQYDILVATLPVNDPNLEGAVSFFFGMTPPLIPNAGEGDGNFRARITQARILDEEKRNAEYRKVFTQSVHSGCILPLFHFSSVVVARDGIDLSRVPTSDETVAFSKVRFK